MPSGFIVYYKAKNAKKFRQGVEYGSARWGNAKDIEPYMDSVFENNVLLTADREADDVRQTESSRSMRGIKIFLLSAVPVPARRAFL